LEGFGGKLEGETPLEIPGHSWHYRLILKCTIKKQKEGLGWVYLPQDRAKRRIGVNVVMNVEFPQNAEIQVY